MFAYGSYEYTRLKANTAPAALIADPVRDLVWVEIPREDAIRLFPDRPFVKAQ